MTDTAHLKTSIQHCLHIARHSGSNFYLAFYSLPRDQFQDMCVLYAFMRHTDDLGDDESKSLEERRSAVSLWRDELQQALDGNPSHEILPALADMAARRELPARYLFEVIDGVESDLEPRDFETFDELNDYCYQVAGAVGLCCLHIWGFDRTDEAIRKAIQTGTAFQLTNILRDLREDQSRDRLYLPVQDLEQFGYTAEELQALALTPAFRELMKFQIERARGYYEVAKTLSPHLSPTGKRILKAMIRTYEEILDQIEKADYDVFSKRIRVSRTKKLAVLCRCLFEGWTAGWL